MLPLHDLWRQGARPAARLKGRYWMAVTELYITDEAMTQLQEGTST